MRSACSGSLGQRSGYKPYSAITLFVQFGRGHHDDALQYEERMHEYAEEDEENREQYEFPEVEKALQSHSLHRRAAVIHL